MEGGSVLSKKIRELLVDLPMSGMLSSNLRESNEFT